MTTRIPALALSTAFRLLLLSAAPAGAAAPNSAAWATRAERTEYRETFTYEETIAYCRRLAAASPWIRLTDYGETGQGRRLPLLVVSRHGDFTPERALRSGRPIVLIQNGIHSGEIEGKDATLALLRDIAVHRRHADLLDQVILLVLPIFSVDAHERRSPWNRINQNGPDSMGWRFTPIGLNLNRDYVKAESPEMRALLGRVYTRWWPHLLVDNHTTNGADYQYDLSTAYQYGPGVPAAIERWMTEAVDGRVLPRTGAMGHVVGPYLNFRDGDPRRGIELGAAPPRFSTSYPVLHGRASILVETHMLKPYGKRVRATYDFMVALLEELQRDPRKLTAAVAGAEREILARAAARDSASRRFALSSRFTGKADTMTYRGRITRHTWSDITGSLVPRYEAAPWDTVVPLYRELEPALTIVQPAGYLVPREWAVVADRLTLHGVRFHRLGRSWADTVEIQRVLDWSASSRSFEGHYPITVRRVALERRFRAFRPGDLWVPLDQRSAPLAIHLLEAQAPDGLMAWNFFDTVFESKEYAEDYVMEPIARRLLAEDPALARAFRERLAADSTFAGSPGARIDFLYRRSPWGDPEHNLHPAARALRPPPEDVLAR